MKMHNTVATALCATALSLSVAAAPAAATTVTNATPIVIVDGGETTSTINVSGLSGVITGLTLSLNGLSHTYPDDLVFGLLNQTLGLGFVFFSGVGGSTDVNNLNLTFSDTASSTLPESFVDSFALTSGTYTPANYGGYSFTFFDNASSFADYFGESANGAWTLYVDDVFPADGGTVANGWSLDFTTSVSAVPEPSTWAMMLIGFGAVGGAMRRRQKVKTTVRFA